jgi:hypothetical protein
MSTTPKWIRAAPGELRRAETIAHLLPEATKDAELHRALWLRGLLWTEAKAAAAGAPPPPGLSREGLATLIAQEIAAVLPLLATTGRLALLGLAAPAPEAVAPTGAGAIDESAADDVAGLGGEDFL